MANLNLPVAISEFASDLYDQINPTVANTRNLVMSPLSIHLAVGLSSMGAAGQTAQEMSKGLRLGNANATTTANEYDQLLRSLKKYVKIANKIYIRKNNDIKSAFKHFASKQFGSDVQKVNFADSDKTANIINEWVKKQTKKKIQNIVKPTDLDESTALVLVNAIYFKGFWTHPFDGGTKKQIFYNANRSTADVDMMHMGESLRRADLKDLDARAISMAYKSTDLSMVIILPNKRNGLDSVNAKIKKTSLAHVLGRIKRSAQVKLALPKFRAEFEVGLKDILCNMGMRSMFDAGSADFSETLKDASNIFISKIIHKTIIDVNETGTEAVAATVEEDAEFSCDDDAPWIFEADHPFRYFIRNSDNVVLFDGCFRHAG